MEILNQILASYVAFRATPVGHDAITGFWVAFVGDMALWLKSNTWKPTANWDFRIATKRWVSGFIIGGLKGAGVSLV